MRLKSGFRMAANWPDMTSIFFVVDGFLLSSLVTSYWPKFHVNILTGSGVMTVFVCKWLTRNPEIGHTPVWVLPNIWRLKRDKDTKFGRNVSSKRLLNTTKCQCYSFYSFWVIKWKPTRGIKLLPPHPD